MIFHEYVAKGSVRGRDGTSISNVADNLHDVTREVSSRCRSGTYRFTTYRQRLLLKGAGKAPRELSIPSVRDRITLRAYAELLTATFPESAGKLPQTAVAQVAAEVATGKLNAYVRIDVKNFYPTVNHDILLAELGTKIKKKEVLRVVRRAVATPTAPDRSPRPRALLTSGVPQGLSISNPLAEIYMRPVDKTMGAIPGISYHRFVDDILILCDHVDAQVVDEVCRKALKAVHLDAHPKESSGKSEVGNVADGFGYLGYVFSSTIVSVRHASVVRLESHLASIHATWRQDLARNVQPEIAFQRFLWNRNLAITGCIFQGTATGWIQYYRQLDDYSLLKRLDVTVNRLAMRYGVPEHPRPKTFMRAYWIIRHPRSRSTRYIPNFDRYELAQMAEELKNTGTNLVGMSDQQVEDAFYRMVSRAVRDLERDIGDVS
ncbi:RNA-directed DNA polymerase [Nocardioides plantarum]|uniref:Reverse transcriptase domain-containing protein n=1 Tax=Nocardioides plantarum TaxID=29299 RepID=A0ABV5KGG6_9ACTN|nr:RNA-directed DNA polymerase [Nocardioides plantarum]